MFEHAEVRRSQHDSYQHLQIVEQLQQLLDPEIAPVYLHVVTRLELVRKLLGAQHYLVHQDQEEEEKSIQDAYAYERLVIRSLKQEDAVSRVVLAKNYILEPFTVYKLTKK